MSTLGQMFGARQGATFMGLPEWDGSTVPAVLLGADGCTPYPSVGNYCAGGPAAIRAASAPFDATKHNFDLGAPAFGDRLPADAGDFPIREDDPEGNRTLILDKVTEILAAGAIPVLLGGDDSLPIPMLQALEPHGPLTILQVDAHIDWREEVEGTRWGLSSTMRRASEMPHVERIIQVGQRGIGSARPSDVRDALDWGVRFVPASDPDLVQTALSHIPEGARVAVCFDCDALDPAIMPAVIGRTAGGLTYAQALALLRGTQAKARIAALDLVEFMPARDVDGLGAMTAAQLLCAALGLLSRP
ncbi:putative agmatinase [Rubellimicrobium mesophilum DSM 19309]|uniref:Putative agmatinase n=1 Tax=Rubellimicrobium mesophilum DSM 19309 TaxID=442562 RepID=A0A017HRV3_9RHOB|nr:arginase family protein [Rubellimicrobium mesophilum]EYD77091.1 putative agmatinase [Rubellimicrobium mesophilum DSM 19309]